MVPSVMGLLPFWSSVPTRNKRLHKESLVGSSVIKTIKLGDRLERDMGWEGCCRSMSCAGLYIGDSELGPGKRKSMLDTRVKVTTVNVNYGVLCHYRVSKWALDLLQVPGYSNEQRIEVEVLTDIQIR